ncbi:hypothetical protein [Brevibacterium permense]|uniref:Uncharacterized protein n=1 Tax=Brevibacterium permense TaxID=234834 RepID=A0ABP4KXP3_9MICO|nr:hypothetical protein [Brevibacterium permense]
MTGLLALFSVEADFLTNSLSLAQRPYTTGGLCGPDFARNYGIAVFGVRCDRSRTSYGPVTGIVIEQCLVSDLTQPQPVTSVTLYLGMIECSTMLVTVELQPTRFAEVAGSARELDRHGRPAGGHRSTI